MVKAAGYVFTDAGVAISAATIDAYFSSDTSHATSKANTTSNSLGYWSISSLAEEKYDFKIVNGSSIRWIMYNDERLFNEIEVDVLKIRDNNATPGSTFQYDIVPALITANRALTLPLIAGSDTLAALGLEQTFTANQFIGNGVGVVIGGSTQITVDGQVAELQVLGTAAADSAATISNHQASATGHTADLNIYSTA